MQVCQGHGWINKYTHTGVANTQPANLPKHILFLYVDNEEKFLINLIAKLKNVLTERTCKMFNLFSRKNVLLLVATTAETF